MALLALRSTLGVTLLVQATFCFADPALPEVWRGVMAVLCGAMLTLGFLTPIVTLLIGLNGALFVLLRVPPCSSDFFGAIVSSVFAAAILIAIFLLGPGAFSLDARMFGRREIIIPQTSSSRR